MKRLAWMAALAVALVVAAYGWNPQREEVRAQEGSGQTLSLPVVMHNFDRSAPLPPGTAALVSVSSNGTQGNGGSLYGDISNNGRFVAFASYASNLVPLDTNPLMDIFVRDLQTGQITLESVSSTGAQASTGSVDDPSISADGRFVAYYTEVSNLVPGDTNNMYDVFVRDRTTGQTTRVSVSSGGTQGNSDSSKPSISGDGRYVAFVSLASNLVPNDSNGNWDVFVHDRQAGETTRVSVKSDGSQHTWADNCSISADGRFVSFRSGGPGLAPGDNSRTHIYVHDLLTGETTLVSKASDGTAGNYNSGELYARSAISGDGQFVAFVSLASNLVPNDTNVLMDVFVHDRHSGETTRVSVSSTGTQGNNHSGTDDWGSPAISSNGQIVSFASKASNLVPGDTNDKPDIFVHDLLSGRTGIISIGYDGAPSNYGGSHPSLSHDGRFIAFTSSSSNLVPGGTNPYVPHVFRHDRTPSAP